MKAAVSILRALQELSLDGKFKIFAIDHRDVFVDMLKQAHKYDNESSVIAEKLEIIKNVSDLVSGYLIDPFYSLPGAIIEESIPGSVGFMVHIENNDYRVESIGSNYCIENLSPEVIKRMGASAVKMFLYYNPDSEYAAASEREILRVAESCESAGIPFLIEPILYPVKSEKIYPEQVPVLMEKMIDRFSKMPITIYKISFPGDLDRYSDEENISICRSITDMLDAPWVIMSSSVPGEVFEKQLELACKGGACGYVAGRAFWKEYVYAAPDRKDAELEKMRESLRRTNHIVDKYAARWTDKISAAELPDEQWYTKL